MFRSSHSSPIFQVSQKDRTLFLVLKEHFGSHFNKARINLISMFILFLVKVQTVYFNRL
jgi:hypothetical protein